MDEVLVRAFGYTVAARYLDNSEEMVRERYSHIETGESGDFATEALEETNRQIRTQYVLNHSLGAVTEDVVLGPSPHRELFQTPVRNALIVFSSNLYR